ncbi:MAG: hypothetical protein HY706_17690 [Candidatus Hydrogenedentes bacterium]|nr:hypothetical protein [Candidatus Hydrogenedentota bacterium]
MADEVYLQEVGEKIGTEQPVIALAWYRDALYAVMDGNLYVVENGALERVSVAPKGIQKLEVLDDALWALTDSGVYRSAGDTWTNVHKQPFVDMCVHLGQVHGATRDDLFRFENGAFVNIKPEGGYQSSETTVIMEDGTQVLSEPVRVGPVDEIASYSGTLYILRRGQLSLIEGKTVLDETIDWGTLPSRNTRDMLARGGCLYVTTDRGVAVLRGMAMTTLDRNVRLPYEDTTCLAEGFEDDLWIGTTRGAIRKVGEQYHYFGAENWLPGDSVHAIVVHDRNVYVATDKGIGIIHYEPYTLQKKAASYERHLEEWGHKRLGFTHRLYWSGEKDGWLREISDNDGGHTAHYLAAMSFKYAATGDPQARANAVDAFKAMVWLEEITGNPGFIARAIWCPTADKGQRSTQGSGGLPAKWYPTPDGVWVWKGDTSSDEVDGHFYSVALFHDLVAQGPEKERAKQHIARIATHILDNGWVLREKDGKPTRWGRWDPTYLLRPYGFYARGLNGMEAQTYMRTAFAYTGDAKYEQGFQQLLDWGYHTYTVSQKQTFPPENIVTWDDELAFRTYHTLLRYTDNPYLRSIYLRSLGRSWEVKRMEHVPWFNFIYGAITGNECEADRAAQFLREYPLDLISYRYTNSVRCDLGPEPGYVPYGGGTRAMSPRETDAKSGSMSTLGYDGGGGGHSVTDPSGWLEAYWMGRYHGFIQAPTVTDPALTTVEPSSSQKMGAIPFDGPARPSGLIPGEP